MSQGLPYRPTDEQRRTVRAMSGYGIPQEDIATFFSIDAKTLRKHFRDEIDKGSIEATTKVEQSLFQMATVGKNVAAAIFWMKARAGWREKHEFQLSQERSEDMSAAELEAIRCEKLERLGLTSDALDPPGRIADDDPD